MAVHVLGERVHHDVGQRGTVMTERRPSENSAAVEGVIRRGIPTQWLAGIEAKPGDASIEKCSVRVGRVTAGHQIEMKRKSWLHGGVDWHCTSSSVGDKRERD